MNTKTNLIILALLLAAYTAICQIPAKPNRSQTELKRKLELMDTYMYSIDTNSKLINEERMWDSNAGGGGAETYYLDSLKKRKSQISLQ